ncbi:glycosyltransferase family 2 protein [Tenacibaculum sp. SG-28]|uniref:glycosyltransferase family 2 protein n=1 Tax=Tenacibaculum sp. SG-28 TaxID=754426 RepID=UPI000CF4381D|nr:glycosyltransferase family 2 protein [Tenacibaculum sp. SG-28]PQJ21100.1 hypothetical protein BSU00_08795 [Tenacibaculum sp. SG-28]
MNNDTLIDENAIKELIITSEKYKGKAIVSGKVYNYDEKDTLQYIGSVKTNSTGVFDYKSPVKNRREKDVGQYDEEMELAMSDDIMWILSREIYEEIGAYSDYFFLYGEQNDYALKAIKKGYKLIYSPKAKIWHKGGITTGGGKKWLKSPKIEYWGTMAVLKLSEFHVEEKRKKAFRRKYTLKNGLKKIFLFLTGRVKYDIVKAHFLAVKHFKFWNKIRYKDNGYNPFN